MNPYENLIEEGGYLVDATTHQKAVFYECDPEKNTGCLKRCCGAAAQGSEESDNFGGCSKTLFPQYRKDGGRSWYCVKKADPEGGEPYWGREYID